MNKSDLIQKLAEQKGITKKRAESVVNIIFESFADSLANDERIEIRGFGSFTTRYYKEYEGRDPRHNTPIHVPPKRLPYFKPSRKLQALINGIDPNSVNDGYYDPDDDE